MMKKTNCNNNNNYNNNNHNNVGKMGGLEWEMRPGGMLVQKRNLDSNRNYSIPIPTIKVLVKYGSYYHEIHINSHATFGELKKMLAEVTGLQPQDQKLIFKDKERESKSFLDVSGVKDGSKIVLVQDIISQEKRFLESRRNSNMERAMKSVVEVAIEVDQLISQVKAKESVICKGGRVAEKELLTLIELLMSQMIKLDGIVADGEVKLKRKTQVVRIQKYIEILDRLKAQNAMATTRYGGSQVGLVVSQQQQREQRNFSNGLMLTSKWEKY
ncbi:BAG family molecular chaperone regulator 1-like [Chenopodium quinoa]|uniref:BAG family molecular chaperone regulator 1-like n=1 Tax=Chenopodium quinoa TaxID=63459 RepID=UPI000B784DE1|nr:BAG family molecular chaperone regulator 1-like [Chenopodium quinoa]